MATATALNTDKMAAVMTVLMSNPKSATMVLQFAGHLAGATKNADMAVIDEQIKKLDTDELVKAFAILGITPRSFLEGLGLDKKTFTAMAATLDDLLKETPAPEPEATQQPAGTAPATGNTTTTNNINIIIGDGGLYRSHIADAIRRSIVVEPDGFREVLVSSPTSRWSLPMGDVLHTSPMDNMRFAGEELASRIGDGLRRVFA
jgi:hypothetical protein